MTQFLDNVAMALGTLRANPLRSLLTLLGIVIGAGTVVAMMSLTEGLRLKVTTDFAMLGARHLPGAEVAGPRQLRAPRLAQVRAAPPPSPASRARRCATCRTSGCVSIEEYPNRPEIVSTRERATRQNVDVGGVLPDYMEANGVTIAEGRFITDSDIALGRRVVVLGADVADLLFPGRSPLGQEVRAARHALRGGGRGPARRAACWGCGPRTSGR